MGVENIDQAIALVYATVDYVQKERATGLGYTFAGEAAIIEVVRPAMVENGIIMRVLEVPEFETDTYTTSKGAVMNRTLLKARIRFTHAPSGSHVDCEALGEGADSGDKSANKAMTGAYKYAIRQTFMIETGDDPDNTPSNEQERAPRQQRSAPQVDHETGELPPYVPAPAAGGSNWKQLQDGMKEAGLRSPVVLAAMAPDGKFSAAGLEDWLAKHPDMSINKLLDEAHRIAESAYQPA